MADANRALSAGRKVQVFIGAPDTPAGEEGVWLMVPLGIALYPIPLAEASGMPDLPTARPGTRAALTGETRRRARNL